MLDSNPMPIGKLINEAKLEYLFTNTVFPDIAISQLFQFNLIGDPAIQLLPFHSMNPDVMSHSVSAGETITLNFDSTIILNVSLSKNKSPSDKTIS